MPEATESTPYTGRPESELARIKAALIDLYTSDRPPTKEQREAILADLTPAEQIRLREIGAR